MFATLEQFFEPIMSQIDRLMGNPTVEGIERIRRQLKTTVLFDVARLRRHYGNLIKAYYERHKPFDNHRHSQHIEQNFSKDIEDFIDLISYATEADDTSILDNWAIDYPCNNRGVLSKDLQVYVETFGGVVFNWDSFMNELEEQNKPRWPDETKPYWAYLANKLSSKL